MSGEDINCLFVIALRRTSLTHAFLTKSRSVIKPTGLSSLSTTNKELTFLSFIFLAVPWTVSNSPTVSILFLMKSLIGIKSLFPITKNDKEIEGINSDRLRFNDAVKKNNDYVIHLSKKYHLHDLEGSSTSFIVSFRPPYTNNQYKTNNNIQTRKRK